MRARAGLGTAPVGDRNQEGLTGTSPIRETDTDEKPLMLLNGGMGDEPKRLGVSAARSAPGTAGSKVRNKRIGQGSNSRG